MMSVNPSYVVESLGIHVTSRQDLSLRVENSFVDSLHLLPKERQDEVFLIVTSLVRELQQEVQAVQIKKSIEYHQTELAKLTKETE